MTAPTRKHLSRLVPRNQHLLVAAIIAVSVVDSVLLGYDSSLMGSLNVMPTYTSYFSLTTATKSLNTAISYVGGASAAFVSGFVVDAFGRKKSIMLAAVLTLIGAVVQTAAQNIGMFIAGRFIVGFGLGFAQTACPTYVAETAPLAFRSVALGLYYAFWGVGTLIASGVCYATQSYTSTWAWRLPSLVQIVPSVLCFAVLLLLPESPRWLVDHDHHDEALEVLAAANAHGDTAAPVVRVQFQEIRDTLAFEKSRQLSLAQAFVAPGNRRRLFITATFSIVVMLPGTNIVTFYFGTMLTQAGISDATRQLEINIILTAWTLVVALLGAWFADALPRKTLCALSLAGQIVTFYILAGLTAVFGTSTDKSGIYASIAMIFLYNGAYAYGITPLTVIYPPEVLSYEIRATGMALYTLTTKLSGLLVTMAFPFALDAIGWKTYIINASADILMLVGVLWFWVETRGLTLEEVDRIFDGEKHSDAPDLSVITAVTVDTEAGAKPREPAMLKKT